MAVSERRIVTCVRSHPENLAGLCCVCVCDHVLCTLLHSITSSVLFGSRLKL